MLVKRCIQLWVWLVRSGNYGSFDSQSPHSDRLSLGSESICAKLRMSREFSAVELLLLKVMKCSTEAKLSWCFRITLSSSHEPSTILSCT